MKASYVSHVVTSLGLIGALAVAAPASAGFSTHQSGSATAQVSDDTLESRIETTLKKDSILAARNIDVESEHGRVKLTGSVRTADEKARAARLAKINGVTAVVNELEIDPNADRSKVDTAADKTKEGLNKAVDATAKGAEKTKEGVQKGVAETEKGLGKAADKTAEALDKAGDKLGNTSISTRVKSDFAKDPMLKDVAIRVDTADRVVTLKGTVPSAAVKARAEEVAARTDGVLRVVNDLVVRSN
jgi:osmotically-inducible protein OsmY